MLDRLKTRPFALLAAGFVLIAGALYFGLAPMRDLAANLAKAQLENFFKQVDTDHDGKVSQDEMLVFHSAIDLNQDGQISQDEIAVYLRTSRAELQKRVPVPKPAAGKK